MAPIIAVATLAMIIFACQTEETAARVGLVCSATALLVTLLLFLSRRIVFSMMTVAALVAIVAIASPIKKQQMNMGVHAYDLFFYLNTSTIQFLWADFRIYLLALAGALIILVLLAVFSYRLDSGRVPRRPVLALLIVFLFATLASGRAANNERYAGLLFFGAGGYLSTFYLSWAETASVLWSGHLIEAAARTTQPPFRQSACVAKGRPPHILVIHHESLAPPEIFGNLNYDRNLDRFFRSGDNQLHKLGVEIYGGGSWLTEFSILTGLSSQSFGNMKSFVQVFMAGRLRQTVPQYLAECGYRSVLFSTAGRNFVSNAKFYDGIGISVYDRNDQGARSMRERDRFYYTNVLRELRNHIEGSNSPILVYIQTNASHFPYNYPLAPNLKVGAGGEGVSPEMNEWLRRIAIARLDYGSLLRELAERFPDEQFLIIRYGDHQPAVTRPLFGLSTAAARLSFDVRPDKYPEAFITFYAIEGQNYVVPPLPTHDVVDVPYLSTLILKAAGLPLPEAHQERMRLMEVCDGRYFGCARQDEIRVFHRRLIDAGLISSQ